MTPPDHNAAIRAAGALVFRLEKAENRIVFVGETEAFGLDSGALAWTDFLARLSPSDQEAVDEALAGERVDWRVRLVAPDGAVTYARLLGRRVAPDLVEGLITPAGAGLSGAQSRIALERAFAEGLKAGEVKAWYQPVICLETGALAGFEALARWERPGLGVMGPDGFLDLADELSLIAGIGDCVRGCAISDLSAWRSDQGVDGLFLAANASVSELISPGFADGLLEALDRAGLPRGCFKLEIAETEIMRDPDRAKQAMNALSEGGVGLALDDFGTGYSSLARLEMLPFDVVKIDQYFVRAMAGNDSATTVVRSVIQLAEHFGMQVVAEGVEEAETAALLAQMGCHFGQGYRFAGALAPDAARRSLSEGVTGRFKRFPTGTTIAPA